MNLNRRFSVVCDCGYGQIGILYYISLEDYETEFIEEKSIKKYL